MAVIVLARESLAIHYKDSGSLREVGVVGRF